MPKGFSEQEKERIRTQLLNRGRELLAQYGIRKTNIEDLTRAVGISKGAFYVFFASKEELFMEILEQYETEMHERVFSYTLEKGQSAREHFKQMLRAAFATWESSAFLRNFDQEDFQYLLRKIPEERVMAHLKRDDAFVTQVLDTWQREGVRFTHDPKTVSGLMKALFFVGLHKDDFGPDAYPATMELLFDMIAERLVED